jgi:nitrogen fixation protein FixH
MKFNWGHGIALFYIVFATVLVIFVVKSTFHDHSLVVDNYYEEDLNYQKHYEKLANSKALLNDVTIKHDSKSDKVTLQFPKKEGSVAGTIHFYRPSDKGKDFTVEIKLDQNFEQSLPVSELSPGLWKLKVDWEAGGKPFYLEESLVL